MALLVARQVLTLRENAVLTRDLEQRVEHRTAELRASQGRFSALVQHSSDLVMVVDPAGLVTYQSMSSERVLGYGSDELVGRSVLDLMDGPRAVEFLETLRSVPTDGDDVHTVRTTWRHADGRACQVEVTLTNLLDNPDVSGARPQCARRHRPRGAREPAHPAGLHRLADRPPEPRSVQGPSRGRAAPARRRRCPVDRLLPRPRRVQGRQRHPGARGRRLPCWWTSPSACSRSFDRRTRSRASAVTSSPSSSRRGPTTSYAARLARAIVERIEQPFQIGCEEVFIAVEHRGGGAGRHGRRRRAAAAQRRPGDVPGQGGGRGERDASTTPTCTLVSSSGYGSRPTCARPWRTASCTSTTSRSSRWTRAASRASRRLRGGATPSAV